MQVPLTNWPVEWDHRQPVPHNPLSTTRSHFFFLGVRQFQGEKRISFFTKTNASALEPEGPFSPAGRLAGHAPPRLLRVKMALLKLELSPASDSQNCTASSWLPGVGGGLPHLWSGALCPRELPLPSKSKVFATKQLFSPKVFSKGALSQR